MTKAQRVLLFIDIPKRNHVSLWTQACQVKGWDNSDRELRVRVFGEALGREIESSSEIGKLEDFNKVKSHMLAIIRPDDFEAQLAIANMPSTNRKFRIKELAEQIAAHNPEAYIRMITGGKTGFAGRFHTWDWESLKEWQLTQLRNTLSARAHARRRKQPETVREAEKVDEELVPF